MWKHGCWKIIAKTWLPESGVARVGLFIRSSVASHLTGGFVRLLLNRLLNFSFPIFVIF